MPITLRLVGIAVVALALAGCWTNDDGRSAGEGTAGASAASRVDNCTDRLMVRAETDGLSDAEQDEVRRYVQTTYCSRFAERGWVYDDGTLSIAAHTWVEEGGEEECARLTETGEETVPCEELGENPEDPIQCAILHHVRRSEVRHYVEDLRRRIPDAECDDGTPLDELGSP